MNAEILISDRSIQSPNEFLNSFKFQRQFFTDCQLDFHLSTYNFRNLRFHHWPQFSSAISYSIHSLAQVVHPFVAFIICSSWFCAIDHTRYWGKIKMLLMLQEAKILKLTWWTGFALRWFSLCPNLTPVIIRCLKLKLKPKPLPALNFLRQICRPSILFPESFKRSKSKQFVK